mgnify:CR=1 FL=1
MTAGRLRLLITRWRLRFRLPLRCRPSNYRARSVERRCRCRVTARTASRRFVPRDPFGDAAVTRCRHHDSLPVQPPCEINRPIASIGASARTCEEAVPPSRLIDVIRSAAGALPFGSCRAPQTLPGVAGIEMTVGELRLPVCGYRRKPPVHSPVRTPTLPARPCVLVPEAGPEFLMPLLELRPPTCRSVFPLEIMSPSSPGSTASASPHPLRAT